MTPPRDWRGRVTYGVGAAERLNEVVGHLPNRLLAITGRQSFFTSGATALLDSLSDSVDVCQWSDFETNANIADLRRGLEVARSYKPDMVIGVGGGSAMDMAKLVVGYLDVNSPVEHEIRSGRTIDTTSRPLVLVPTTSGSGSEATHFAVVYIGDTKYSVAGSGLYASNVILDPSLTVSGSSHQRATSGIDAICQSIESMWARGATAHSRRLARHALGLMLPTVTPYVRDGDMNSARAMAIGSHLSGRAIDISKTTGAHALSYYLTKHFGIPHGHAVAVTLGGFIHEHHRSVESQSGDEFNGVRRALDTLQALFAVSSRNEIAGAFDRLVDDLGLQRPPWGDISIDAVIDDWAGSVNAQRMLNNPVDISGQRLENLLRSRW